MADAQDLKSWGRKKPCGFESHHRHRANVKIRNVLAASEWNLRLGIYLELDSWFLRLSPWSMPFIIDSNAVLGMMVAGSKHPEVMHCRIEQTALQGIQPA